ncbi:hypothetical protein [Gymnodinialimonas hymeniacidonis]|uniref:hypothetical protein n=1 Tax=Gymnodinialimonas hymeniacidonis TaxID=3126508 RepID=UPI0034C64469
MAHLCSMKMQDPAPRQAHLPAYLLRYGQDAQEIRSAAESLRDLRASVRVAEEVGEGLG